MPSIKVKIFNSKGILSKRLFKTRLCGKIRETEKILRFIWKATKVREARDY